MHLFDPQGVIKKYHRVEEILDDFFYTRHEIYGLRLQYQKKMLAAALKQLDSRVRFLEFVSLGKIKLVGSSKRDLEKELSRLAFPTQQDLDTMVERAEETKELSLREKGCFDYLLSVPLWNLTQEKVESTQLEQKKTKEKLTNLENTTIESLWFNELELLREALQKDNSFS